MRECEICGRPLKTGRKYCYTCRSLQHAKNIGGRKQKKRSLIGDSFLIFLLGISLVLFGIGSLQEGNKTIGIWFILISFITLIYAPIYYIYYKQKAKERNQNLLT